MKNLIKGFAKSQDERELLMRAEAVGFNKKYDKKGSGGLLDLALEVGFDDEKNTRMLWEELWARVEEVRT